MEWIVEAEDIGELLDGRFTAQIKPLVRCKDCIHWCNHARLNIPWCRELHIDRGAADYCSLGERRTDGEEVH